ncbi:hypothetical protein V2J09_023388 [Rumex salicifolius]
MERFAFRFHICTFICAVVLFLGKLRSCESAASLFVFGDSYFDAGNNNYINTTILDKANFWPYGITFFKFPTGRFSDGRLISDFIAEHAKLPLILPYLQPGKHDFSHGVNFASAGAGALNETFQGLVISLGMQLSNYNKVVAKLRDEVGGIKARMIAERGVYLFSIGTNDYMSTFLTNSQVFASYSKSKYIEMVMSNITLVIKGIYDRGGRKFGFVNVPPVGCLPGIRILNGTKEHGCLKVASDLTILHNRAFLVLLKRLERQLPGLKFALFDLHNSLLQRIKHPYKYGYKEGKSACCGSGKLRATFSCGRTKAKGGFKVCKNVKDYVFWDSFHLTEMAYKQLADQMWTYNYTSKSPLHSAQLGAYNLKTLFHLP